MFFVLLGGAALTAVELTGTVGAVLDSLGKCFVRSPLLVLPLGPLLFLVGGASYTMGAEIVAIVPLPCALMRKLPMPNTIVILVAASVLAGLVGGLKLRGTSEAFAEGLSPCSSLRGPNED